MEQKATFHFASEANPLAPKTTIIKVKTIQLENEAEIYQFPAEARASSRHTQLFQHDVVKAVIKTLEVRNKFRMVKITLKGELLEQYLDEEGNVWFEGIFLEVVQAYNTPSPLPSGVMAQPTASLSKIAKDMVLDKFDGKNGNAITWLNTFTSEYVRFNVSPDRYADMLRLFLEGTALEWYSGLRKSSTAMQAWHVWNNSFIDTFNTKSWADIAYAYEFRFFGGSILHFALEKRNLLLDVNKDLTVNSQINLIVTALPREIRTLIIASQVKSIDELMSVLSGLELTVNKHSDNTKEKQHNANKPCFYYESLNYAPNYYYEANYETLTHERCKPLYSYETKYIA